MMQDFSNKVNLKDLNVKRIYNILRENSQMTKSELARESHLSFVSVSKICSSLEESGLVEVSDKGARTGGRKAALITFKPDSLWSIAIDIHRTDHMEMGILDLNNKIIDRKGFEIPESVNLEEILHLIEEGIRILSLEGARIIIGICIGISAVYDPKSSILLQSSNSIFERVNLVRYLQEKLPEHHFIIENDANLASLSQAGLPSHVNNQLFLFFTQGIGLGIIINGELYRGTNGFAGELGHIKVTGFSKSCKCGGNGCFRTVATLYSIAEDLGELNLLKKIKNKKYSEQLLNRYMNEERDVVDRVNLTIEKIGEVLADLFDLFNPEEIILGGNMTSILSHQISSIRKGCRQLSNLAREVDIQIRVMDKPSNDLVLQGAGERVFRYWFDFEFSPVSSEA